MSCNIPNKTLPHLFRSNSEETISQAQQNENPSSNSAFKYLLSKQILSSKEPCLGTGSFSTSGILSVEKPLQKTTLNRRKYTTEGERKEARLKQIRDAMRRSRERKKEKQTSMEEELETLRSKVKQMEQNQNQLLSFLRQSHIISDEALSKKFPWLPSEPAKGIKILSLLNDDNDYDFNEEIMGSSAHHLR